MKKLLTLAFMCITLLSLCACNIDTNNSSIPQITTVPTNTTTTNSPDNSTPTTEPTSTPENNKIIYENADVRITYVEITYVEGVSAYCKLKVENFSDKNMYLRATESYLNDSSIIFSTSQLEDIKPGKNAYITFIMLGSQNIVNNINDIKNIEFKITAYSDGMLGSDVILETGVIKLTF